MSKISSVAFLVLDIVWDVFFYENNVKTTCTYDTYDAHKLFLKYIF